MKKHLLIIAFVSVYCAGGAAARAAAPDCSKAETQMEMNDCSRLGYAAADKALNAAWKKVVAKIGAESGKRKKLLVETQRAWIAFRDKECEFESSEFEGGTMRPMIENSCLAGLTEARTKVLELLLED